MLWKILTLSELNVRNVRMKCSSRKKKQFKSNSQVYSEGKLLGGEK